MSPQRRRKEKVAGDGPWPRPAKSDDYPIMASSGLAAATQPEDSIQRLSSSVSKKCAGSPALVFSSCESTSECPSSSFTKRAASELTASVPENDCTSRTAVTVGIFLLPCL